MSKARGQGTPGEMREVRAAFRLALRGYALVLIAGTLWHWPIATRWIELAVAALACVLVYFSVLPLIMASVALRNIVGRNLRLDGHKTLILTLGSAILLVLLLIAAVIFGLGRYAYGA